MVDLSHACTATCGHNCTVTVCMTSLHSVPADLAGMWADCPWADEEADVHSLPNRKKRALCYWWHARPVHGMTGQHVRGEHHRCVLSCVRHLFPETDGNHCGHRESRKWRREAARCARWLEDTEAVNGGNDAVAVIEAVADPAAESDVDSDGTDHLEGPESEAT